MVLDCFQKCAERVDLAHSLHPVHHPTTPTKSKSQCYRIHFIHEHASVTNTILIYRVLFPHSVFHLGFGVFLSGEVWCVPSASPLYGGRCLTQLFLFSSDLVNGLVALMNSNVSSPVNLVSTVLPLLCSSWRVFRGGLCLLVTGFCGVCSLLKGNKAEEDTEPRPLRGMHEQCSELPLPVGLCVKITLRRWVKAGR